MCSASHLLLSCALKRELEGAAVKLLLLKYWFACCLVQMLPHTTRVLEYVVVPLTSGKLQLPQFSLTSSRSDSEWFSDFSDKRRAVLVNP